MTILTNSMAYKIRRFNAALGALGCMNNVDFEKNVAQYE